MGDEELSNPRLVRSVWASVAGVVLLAGCAFGSHQPSPRPAASGSKSRPAAPAVASPAASPKVPPLIRSLRVVPAAVSQGDTVDIRLSFNAAPAAWQLTVNGTPYPAYPVGVDRYRLLLGTDPWSATGSFQVLLSARGPAGTVQAATGYRVLPRPYPRRTVTLPSGKVALLSPQVGQEEEALAGAALAVRTDRQLWSGPFQEPIPGAPIDSPYGEQGVYNGRLEWFHGGVDFTAKTGTPVHAAAAGMVTLARHLPRGGDTVIVNHGQGVFSEYLHLSRSEVAVGQVVSAGQVVGLVGATGLTTGPGLHWGVFVNGIPVDPLSWAQNPPA